MAHGPARGARRHRRTPQPAVGRGRARARLQPRPCTCTPPGASFAHVVYRLGTEEQRKVAERMVEGRWGATMVLTEPDAGSDVGAGRTKAIQQADGTWHIEGVKRFITSAEHDMAENIVHLVLARPEGAGRRHQGPVAVHRAQVPTSTGRPASSASATASTSPTSSTRWASRPRPPASSPSARSEPAVGWLVGEVHDGIAQMFKIIEFARMMVGTKAIATLSTGYLNALDYAKTRMQGADLTRMTDKTAPRVADHPPPRRTPVADAAEGVRRGHARAGPLHRDHPGRRGAGRGRGRGQRRARPGRTRSTTCCCRSSRATARRSPTSCWARSRCRPSAARATCRTTRSSSTSGTPRSTRSTRAPRRSRGWTSSSARSCGTRARR